MQSPTVVMHERTSAFLHKACPGLQTRKEKKVNFYQAFFPFNMIRSTFTNIGMGRRCMLYGWKSQLEPIHQNAAFHYVSGDGYYTLMAIPEASKFCRNFYNKSKWDPSHKWFTMCPKNSWSCALSAVDKDQLDYRTNWHMMTGKWWYISTLHEYSTSIRVMSRRMWDSLPLAH